MRFAQIGQQLRAFRLESGLRAEEIAARLGISRAALYRYEKGEVIKLETLRRLAELLKISPLALLGIGIEYFSRSAGFFERIADLEEEAEQILFVGGAFCPLLMSPEVEAFLAEAWPPLAEGEEEPLVIRTGMQQLLAQFAERRRRYQARRPALHVVLEEGAVREVLTEGLLPGIALGEGLRRRAIALARAEVATLANLMEALPLGVQIGVLDAPGVTSPFELLRGREKTFVCISPFRPDTPPHLVLGVAMITAADEALAGYQRIAEQAWARARKGSEGATRLRRLLVVAERAEH